MLKFSVETKNT